MPSSFNHSISQYIYKSTSLALKQPTLRILYSKVFPCLEKLLSFLLPRQIAKVMMAIRLPDVLSKQNLRQSVLTGSKAPSRSVDVPKGFLAVYVGEAEKKRCVVPVSYLNRPTFQDLLSETEEEFGFHQSMGGLTIPCPESAFLCVTSSLSRL